VKGSCYEFQFGTHPLQPITTSQLGNTQILHYTCKIGYGYLIRVVCSATSGLGYEATTLKCTPATLETEQPSPSSGLYMDYIAKAE